MVGPAAREKSHNSDTKLELRGRAPERKLPIVEQLRQLLEKTRADNHRLQGQVEQAEAEVCGPAHRVGAFDTELEQVQPGREWQALQRFDDSYAHAEPAQFLPALEEPADSATTEDKADYRRALTEQYCTDTFIRDDKGTYSTVAETSRETALAELVKRMCSGVKPEQVSGLVSGVEHKIQLLQRDSALADAARSFSRGGMEIIVDTLARSALKLEHPTEPLTDRTIVAHLEAMTGKKADFLRDHPGAETNYDRIKRVARFEGSRPLRPEPGNITAAADSLLERFAQLVDEPGLVQREIASVLNDLKLIFKDEMQGGYYRNQPDLADLAHNAYPGYNFQDYGTLGKQLCERLNAASHDDSHYDVDDFKTPNELAREVRLKSQRDTAAH